MSDLYQLLIIHCHCNFLSQKKSISASYAPKDDIRLASNLAYGHIEGKGESENPKREEREMNESEYEVCDTGVGEATYETVPV